MTGRAMVEAAQTSTVCVLCGVRALLCAIPTQHVVEVMRPLPVHHLDDVPPFVLGVALVRGAPNPVVDAARLLGVADTAAEQRATNARYVSVRANERGRCLSLRVDDVRGVRALARREMDQLPPLLRAVDARGAAAIGALDAELLLVLDAARLVPESVWSTVSLGVSPT